MNKMRKFGNTLLLTLALVAMTATAGATPIKHERVFAVIGAAGDAATILAHNHLENVDALDTLEDATTLTEIENIAGEETFTQEDGSLRWQANGRDITYRGRGEKVLPVTPVVSYTLNGEPLPAADVAKAEGTLCITVTYTQTEQLPMLAATLLPIPDGVSHVAVEDALLLSEGGKQMVLGWGVPGADEALELPTSFCVTCDVQQAAFEQMVTVITAEPLVALLDAADADIADADAQIADVTALLSAMQSGEALPELPGKLGELAQTLTELSDGVTRLKDGAGALCDGTATLGEGAAALQEGLDTLKGNNAALNDGAAQIVDALLETANAQLAEAGLDALGIALPALTMDNYNAVLSPVIAQLADADAVEAQIRQAAQAQVAAKVEENDEAIRAAVTQAVEAQVLEAVLAELKLPLTAESYAAAVQAGQVSAEQDAQIRAAVAAQMQTAPVAEALEAAVQEQKDALTAQGMESDTVKEQIVAGLAAAQGGAQALTALQAKLDSVNAFATGLAAYTAGVEQAAAGAAQLSEGTSALLTGATQLRDGTQTLADGLTDGQKTMAEKVLPWLTEDVAKLQQAVHAMQTALREPVTYDAIGDGMAHDLVVFVRTEMNR